MELHPDVQALVEEMRALEGHLHQHDAAFWADHVVRCRGWIENSDAYGLSRFLGLFGGMGSLNDLVLQRGNDFMPAENDELQRLLERAYRLAAQLGREEPR